MRPIPSSILLPMRTVTAAWLVALAVLFAAHPSLAQPAKGDPDKAPFHATRILVKLKEGERKIAQQPVLRQHGLKVRRQFRAPGLERLAVLDVEDVAEAKAARALAPAARARRLGETMAALQASGRFEFVEPDYLRSANATPIDSAFTDGTLWALRNTGQNGGSSGTDIGAVAAWDITTGSPDVLVAVVDTGIRYTHQDLAANMWRNPGESGDGRETNGKDDDNNDYIDDVFGINAIPDRSDPAAGNPADDNGHGTHVAGTIGAAANNAGPHVGVAWNVRIMACKFLDSGGGGYLSDEVECIDYAMAKGARVINASYGGYYFSRAEYEVMASLRDHGVLFVAAAGNESWNNDSTSQRSYPASHDLANILSVAALDRSDGLCSFSNYGASEVDLGAPGDAIFSCWIDSDSAYATHQGTSMAAPHVTGAAALVMSKFPAAPLAEVRRRLLDTTVPVPALAGKTVTGGRLNVANALTATPTGALAGEITPQAGSSFSAGKPGVFRAVVTDLQAVTNATVTASADGLGTLALHDDGTIPDTIAADGVYAAGFTVPATGNQMNVTFQASAAGYTPVVMPDRVYPIIYPPTNDDFANRITIPASTGFVSVTGSNLNASKENGEPTHAGRPDGRSVWWTWTAPFTGPVRISTAGSGYDTLLAVYTGSTLASLVSVAANDDASYRDLYSSVRFNATLGTVYQLAVDGYAAQQGGIVLGVLPVISTVPLPEAVDQPVLVIGSAGTEPWLGQTDTTHDGTDAVRSGPIEAFGQSVMETTVEGPGFLSFWWQVSSEANYDFLRFTVDGVEKAAISGDSGWQRQTLWVGTRSTLRWTYSKDRDVSVGQDAGWVDEISLEHFAPAIPSRFVDLDRDGRPTVRDLALLTGYLKDSISLLPQLAAFADVNGDGMVNHPDIQALADAILERTTLRAAPDADGDGIPDPLEALLGLDPTKQDSNNDGTTDGQEDFDQDTLTNADEITYGFDPLRLDTDGDGWADETEFTSGSNPLEGGSQPYMMVMARPAVSLVLPADEGTGGLAWNTVVARPPVSLVLPADEGTGGLPWNTIVAKPPVSLVLPADEGTGGLGWNTFVAKPPVSLLLPANEVDGGQAPNTFIARPPVQLRLNSP